MLASLIGEVFVGWVYFEPYRIGRICQKERSLPAPQSAVDNSLESASIDLSEEDVSRLITAIEHYDAYIRSQKREDSAYRELADRLQQVMKKPAGTATSRQAAKVKSR